MPDFMPVIRQIPGYPKVDRDNDYLMARFDGAVLDAKPWGRGVGSNDQLPASQSARPADRALSQLEVRRPGRSLALKYILRTLRVTSACLPLGSGSA